VSDQDLLFCCSFSSRVVLVQSPCFVSVNTVLELFEQSYCFQLCDSP